MDTSNLQKTGAMPVAAAMAPPPPDHNRRELIQAVKAVNGAEFLGADRELAFARDHKTGRSVVRIVDRNTKEVVQQLPPEYVLRLAEDLRQANSRTDAFRR